MMIDLTYSIDNQHILLHINSDSP